MSSHQIQLALWISQSVLHAVLASVLLRRKVYKEFPAFVTYAVVELVIYGIQFPAYYLTSSATYFYVYWGSEGLNVVLAFRIIHEVFLDVFRPYPALKDLGTALFKWAAVIMVLVSVVLISLVPGWDDPVARSIMVVQRGVNVVQCGLVVFLLAFCKNLGVTWRRQSFGIALGFGIFPGVQLLGNALWAGTHLRHPILGIVYGTAYCLAVMVWIFYALLNGRCPVVTPVLVPQRWDEALMDIQPQAQTESLIPMFEHIVDRALSRAQESRVH
jgi:hypothetical protein